MSHIEEASSLFDTGDGHSDIFGLVQEQATTPDASSGVADTLGVNGHAPDGSSEHLLNSDSYNTDPYGEQQTDYTSQGWYDEDGQFHYYEDPQVGSFDTHDATYSTSSNSYDPYAHAKVPQSTSTYSASSTSLSPYAPPPNTSTLSAYDSYVPSYPQAATSASNAGPVKQSVSQYAPPSINGGSHSYDRYNPSTTTYAPHTMSQPLPPSSSFNAYSSPSRLPESGSHYMMYGSSQSQNLAQPPPPPKPVVRPAVANAYDPPLPKSRTSQRGRTLSGQGPFHSPPGAGKHLTPSPPLPNLYQPLTHGGSGQSFPPPARQSSSERWSGPSLNQSRGPYGPETAYGNTGSVTPPTNYPASLNSVVAGQNFDSNCLPQTEPPSTLTSGLGLMNAHVGNATTLEHGSVDNERFASSQPLTNNYSSAKQLTSLDFSMRPSPNPPFHGRQLSSDSLSSDYPASVPLPPSRTLSPASERAKSPASIHDAYTEEIVYQPLQTDPSEPLTAKPTVGQHYDPYRPPTAGKHMRVGSSNNMQGTTSPTNKDISPIDERARDPYAPSTTTTFSSLAMSRPRSVSNASAVSSFSTTGHYEPPYHPTRQETASSGYDMYSPGITYAPANKTNHSVSNAASFSPAQEVSLPAPTYAPYVPSPSLSGVNDPLGRARARVPVVHFGWGGKVVTCFHNSPALETGFDVAVTSHHSTDVVIRPLYTLIPRSALEVSEAEYPGPLFSDPGTPTTGLVRTGAAVQTKNKKARVVQYLEERATELSQGLGYFQQTSPDLRRAEGKLTLVKLLKVLVEYDGRLSGGSAAEAAVSVALVPRLDGSAHGGPSLMTGFTSVMGRQDANDTPLATYTLRPSHLEKLQDFLLRGETRKAYHYALDEKLWAHAMVIASSVDKASWKEVVQEFIQSELGVRDSRTAPPLAGKLIDANLPPNGQESLRVLYSLFSGQGSQAVQHLAPARNLARGEATLQPPSAAHLTPMSPHFPQATATVSPENLIKWNETAAAIHSSHMTSDASAALTSLGDLLLANDWVEAAHICYILSPQTSIIGSTGTPSVRLTLLGSNPTLRSFGRDPDSFIFSEILEFALSLHTPPKGQEPFSGLPHLQPYRLIRALHLVELGHIPIANRYCDAILAATARPHVYFNASFSDTLREIKSRLTGESNLDKTWMGGRMAKPSIDSIGNWIVNKFIDVDGDSSPTPDHAVFGDEKAFIGPFSHYSTISSTVTSTSPSPTPSLSNVPPHRTSSAMSTRPALVSSLLATDRSASAMDGLRPRMASPGPRTSSASAAVTTFAQSESFDGSHGYSSYGSNGNATQHGDDDTASNAGSWWGSSTYSDSGATPTAPNFVRPDGPVASLQSEGFISLMDNGHSSMSSLRPSVSSHPQEGMDEDDLGLGNSKSRGKAKMEPSSPEEPKVALAAVPEAKKDVTLGQKPATSWWGKIWGGGSGSSSGGPVKANLGEESAFYYDKERKRWVNKNAPPEEEETPLPPPPPSRPQSAAPTRAGTLPPPPSSPGLPPRRPASAMDSASGPGAPPSRPPTRARSNLVPEPGELSSATPPPRSADSPGPPPSRPRSQATVRKNVRSRYVDVFQQEQGSA